MSNKQHSRKTGYCVLRWDWMLITKFLSLMKKNFSKSLCILLRDVLNPQGNWKPRDKNPEQSPFHPSPHHFVSVALWCPNMTQLPADYTITVRCFLQQPCKATVTGSLGLLLPVPEDVSWHSGAFHATSSTCLATQAKECLSIFPSSLSCSQQEAELLCHSLF